MSQLGEVNVSHPELERPGFVHVSQSSRDATTNFDSGDLMSAANMCPISCVFYLEFDLSTSFRETHLIMKLKQHVQRLTRGVNVSPWASELCRTCVPLYLNH